MTGSHLCRRRFLQTASTAAGSAVALSYARFLGAQPPRLQTVPVADGMVAVIGPNATVLAADSSDGIVMVDGGDAAWSDALLQTVGDSFGGKPFRALFNTHWHAEQTGSNETLGAQGAEIIAHENTKLWLGTEVWVRWSDKKYPPLPPAARPDDDVLRCPRRRRLSVRHASRRMRPPAESAHGRRHVGVLPGRERARGRRRRLERRLADHRLVDRRLDRRDGRCVRHAARSRERAHANRSRQRAGHVAGGPEGAAADVSDDFRPHARAVHASSRNRRGSGRETDRRVRRASGATPSCS